MSQYTKYLLKFLGIYTLCYLSYRVVDGLSNPNNLYLPILVDLDPVKTFGMVLLSCTKAVLSLIGYESFFQSDQVLRIHGGAGLYLAPPCMGFAVMGFWTAFVWANRGSWMQKIAWATGGCMAICAINVLRFTLLLLVFNRGRATPLGIDQHTWFNIMAYGAVILMMIVYDQWPSATMRTER